MKKRRKLKKGLAILLTAAMVVGLMPSVGTLQVSAAESDENTVNTVSSNEAMTPEPTPEETDGQATEKLITAWQWIDEEEILDEETGNLALLGASEQRPAYFDDVTAFLPSQIHATVVNADDLENPETGAAEEPITLEDWSCDNYPEEGAYSGSYTFTAALPEGYSLSKEAVALAVTVELGGARTYETTGVDGYDNGFCTTYEAGTNSCTNAAHENCSAYQPATDIDNDGVYEISNAGQLCWFAGIVNGTVTGVTQNISANAILTKDIDFGNCNFVSIGKTDTAPFSGTFDGGSHTITVNQSESSDVALFGFLGNATVKNLTVTGTINTTTTKFAAGIAMQTKSGTTATVENCISDVTIESSISGDGTHAGLVGVPQGSLNINNCAFTGAINGASTNSCGGMIGYAKGTVRIKNSYIAASFSLDATSCHTFSRNFDTWVTLDNCYYLNALGDVPASAKQLTSAQFSNGEAAYLLQGDQTEAVWGQNVDNGQTKQNYPVLGGAKVYGNKTYCGSESNPGGVIDIKFSNTEGEQTYGEHDMKKVEAKSPTCTEAGNIEHWICSYEEGVYYKDENRTDTYDTVVISATGHSYGEDGICTVCGVSNKVVSRPEGEGTTESPYKISTPGELLWFAGLVNGTLDGVTQNASANAKLTKDIDFGNCNFVSIGKTDTAPFSGVFDGGSHTITVNQSGSPDVALFRYLGNCTVKNLTVTGTIATDVQAAAGIAMRTVAGTTATIEKCISGVTIESSINGDGTHGGFVGVPKGELIITKCAFTGAINGESTNACGGMIGYAKGEVNIKYSYIAATFNLDATSCHTFSRNFNSCVTLYKCYYLNALGDVPSSATRLTEEQFSNGEAAYLLQGKLIDHVWGQNLDNNQTKQNHPVLGGAKVYENITYACPGSTTVAKKEYSNTQKAAAYGEHSMQQTEKIAATCNKDGYTLLTCSTCGATEKTSIESALGHDFNQNGVCIRCTISYAEPSKAAGDGTASDPYRIECYGQLVWFQEQVDGGDYDAYAILTADITANESLLSNGAVSGTPAYTWKPIRQGADSSTAYKGVFDGKGHTIKGLYVPATADQCGLFGVSNGTIKNIFITDSYFGNGEYNTIGSFVGVGYNSSVIENCGSDAVVVGKIYCGGIAGTSYGEIKSCCYAGKITGAQDYYMYTAPIKSEYYSFGKETNCCYLSDCGATSPYAASMTSDQFKSGEACYFLNHKVTDGSQAWYQKLGTDNYPVFSGDTVYYRYDAAKVQMEYSNTCNDCPHERYENGFCVVCGEKKAPDLIDGIYQIANYGNLVWFQEYVDSGAYSANAVLTADITANENLLSDGKVSGTPKYIWKSICCDASNSDKAYGGVFDGQGHTIKGIYASYPINCALFGKSKGTIKNTFITDSYFGKPNGNYVASFVGYGYKGSTVENCGSNAVVVGYLYCGGIVGLVDSADNTTVKNCYFAGTLDSGSSIQMEYSNAIISEKNSYCSVVNCYYSENCGVTATNAIKVTEDQFKSGEVCYLLNNKVTDGSQAWYQTLGTDNYPVLKKGETVYLLNTGKYTNDQSSVCTHSSYTNGFCDECGKLEAPTLLDGKYQIANYGNLVWFQEYVDSGAYRVSAVLTADITANESLLNNGEVSGIPKYTWTPIAQSVSDDKKVYSGEFDGQGHTISGLYVPSSSDYCALFGKSNGTIKNTFLYDCYFGGSGCSYTSSFVGEGYSSCVIENCGCDAVVVGNEYCGGIAGKTAGTIKDCYFAGKITAGSNSNAIACDSAGTLTNCYYLSDCGLTSTGATAVTEDRLKSGEVCYLLNHKVTDGSQLWYQTLGRNNYPVLSGDTVYYGYSAENAKFEYSNLPLPDCPHESCINGFCSVCGTIEEPKLIDGKYQIANYGNLIWFQKKVDSGSYDADAVLTADITANESLLSNGEVSGNPKYTWTPISQRASDFTQAYRGEFDGQGHTISGLYVSSSDYCALFGKLIGTVKNVIITDSYFGGSSCNYTASIVGEGNGSSVIENCGSDAVVVGREYCGGIAGKTIGTVRDCYFAGKITAEYRYNADAIALNYISELTNCYYLSDCGLTSTATAVTKDQFKSGEVCYLLNHKVTDGSQIWYQTLGSDNYPVLSGDTVYYGYNAEKAKMEYSNSPFFVACPHDNYTNGFCDVCDNIKEPALIEGKYQIANYGNLVWFQQKVASGKNSIDAVLTADITANENLFDENGMLVSDTSGLRQWKPIGNVDNGYYGIFDGNGKTISGLYSDIMEEEYVGLFGSVGDSGNVFNVGVADSYFSGNNYAGGLCGENNGTITNCYSIGEVSGRVSFGGVCGINNGTITNCYTVGSVGGTGFVGGVCGINNGIIKNCYISRKIGGVVSQNNGTITNVESKTIEQFNRGEVAYLLQSGQTEAENGNIPEVWGQKLGDNGDAYPVLKKTGDEGNTVYQYTCVGNAVYTNDSTLSGIQIQSHAYSEQGICNNCHHEYSKSDLTAYVSSLSEVAEADYSDATFAVYSNAKTEAENLATSETETSAADLYQAYCELKSAYEVLKPVALTVGTVASPSNTGKQTGGGRYAVGDTVTLTAEGVEGWTFNGWYDSEDKLISDKAEVTFTVTEGMSGAVSYTAKYTHVSHTMDENSHTCSVCGINYYKVTFDYGNSTTEETYTTGNVEFPAGDYIFKVGETVIDTSDYTVSEDTTITVESLAEAAKYAVTITGDAHCTLTVTDSNGNTVVNGDEVAAGTILKVSVKVDDGYTLTTTLESSYTVSEATTITAVTEAKTYAVTVDDTYYKSGEAGAPTASVDDLSAVPYGTSLTLTAADANSGYEFLGWYQTNGKQLTAEKVYTVTITSALTVQPRYQMNSGMVTFVANDSVVGTFTGTSITEENFPETPVAPSGYEFDSWDKTVADINTMLADNNVNVTVTATFKKISNSFMVSVYNGNATDPENTAYEETTRVIVTAQDIADMNFAYWTLNGEIQSYNKTASFYASSDCVLKAVYSDVVTTAKGTATLQTGNYDISTKRLSMVCYLTVPDDCTMVKAGVIAASGTSSKYNAQDELTMDNADYVKTGSNLSGLSSLTYTWIKSNVSVGDAWYARAYVTYTDSQNNTVTVYGDRITLNAGTDYDYTEKASARINNVSWDASTKRATFVSYITVPDGAVMEKAGIVAANSSAYDPETAILTTENAAYVKSGTNLSSLQTLTYTWIKSNVSSGDIWYARAYVIYKDEANVSHMVYGNIIKYQAD